ncbi:MAG: cyclase family protein [Nocardioidaceae bacterium]
MTESVQATRNDDRLIELFGRVTNAGRWGPDDELGTLNYITPDKRRQAAALIRTGQVLSLAHPLSARATQTGPAQIEHRMLYGNVPDGSLGSASEHLALEVHQHGVTHLDCVSHVAGYDGTVYNGRRFDEIATDTGLSFGSVFAQREGIVSRGVLLDVAAARGVGWLDPSEEITRADLEAAEQYGGSAVGSGDVVVVRAGVGAREATLGPSPLGPGPGGEAALWLHEREVAVYTGDAPEHLTTAGASMLGLLDGPETEVEQTAKTRFPLAFHQVCIPAMGLVLLDYCRVEELALHCRGLGRYDFFFVVAPLVLPGGTGSPVNPLAIF